MSGTTEKNACPPRPKPLPVIPGNIPTELTALNQWVVWRYELSGDGKWTKVPFRVADNRKASSTDPKDWTSFQRALTAYQQGRYDGIGFVCTPESGIVGVDLDHCCNATWEPWAVEIIETLNSYSEFSPSGTGVRIFVKGSLPDGRRRKGNIEMYASGRYFTVTGHVLTNSLRTIESRHEKIAEIHAKFVADKPQPKTNPSNGNCARKLSDDELLKKAFAARNGDKLKRLFGGDTSEHQDDNSAADMAFCQMLVFWTDDPRQVDRIFRRSGLMRDKWDEKHGAMTYGEATIKKVFANRTGRYERRTRADGYGPQDNGDGCDGEEHRAAAATASEPAIDSHPYGVEEGRIVRYQTV